MQKHDSEEVIDLLINLINYEQKEREQIAGDLHNKKSNLLLISWLIDAAEKEAEKGKLNTDCFVQSQDLLSTAINELRAVCNNIFPKIVTMAGLHAGFKNLVNDSLEKYGLEVDLHTNLDAKLPAATSKEVAIYRICMAMLEYFAIAGCKQVRLEAVLSPEKLSILAHGAGLNHLPEVKDAVDNKIKIFKARLISQCADVDAQTNWHNNFKFSFTVENSYVAD